MYRTAGLFFVALLAFSGVTLADKAAKPDRFQKTMELFKNAGASKAFFGHAYGFAVFPTIAGQPSMIDDGAELTASQGDYLNAVFFL